jgi:hypothetical protein
MIILIKIATIIIALCFGNSFIDFNEYISAIISYAIMVYLSVDVCNRGRLHLLGNYMTYPNKSSLIGKDAERYVYWNDYDASDATIPPSHRKYAPKNLPKTEVDKISSAMKTTTTPIEFCGDAEIKYLSKETPKEVTKPQTTSVSKMQQQKAEKAPKETYKDLIMVINEEDLHIKRKFLYEALLTLFKENGYKGDKLYSVLQSIAHIDMTFKHVIYYLDTTVLTHAKIGLDADMLDKIVETTRKTLRHQDIVVDFTEKKNVTILNYYLTK